MEMAIEAEAKSSIRKNMKYLNREEVTNNDFSNITVILRNCYGNLLGTLSIGIGYKHKITTLKIKD